MVSERSPVYIAFDTSNTPSSLNIFADSDVLAIDNGGTGASSLATFASSMGQALSATTVSATTLSATTVSALNLFTNPSSITLGTTQRLPIPNPFAYIALTGDDAASADEKHVGYSNTPTVILSDSNDITWNDTSKQFNVSAAGTYECMGCITFEGGATLVTCKVNKNGTAVLTVIPRVHSTVDPVERTIRAIFTADLGDSIDISYDSNSGNTVKAITGSTITLKRLL